MSTLTHKKVNTVDLFNAVKLGPIELANRMVMAPMTRNRAAPGNLPQAINAKYYAQRAAAGLIITEATQVSRQGIGYPNTPGLHNQEQVQAWRTVTDAVHAKGGKVFVQLFHVGRISHPTLQDDGALPVAPSAIKPDGEAITYEGPQAYVTPRALATEEIPAIVAQFSESARLAQQAGFDGIEIHAANGYLIDQFLRDGSNQRQDAYGGGPAQRARLLLEILEAVIAVWGPAGVGVRLSPLNPFNSMRDSNPAETFAYVANALNALPLAYLHVIESGNKLAGPNFDTGLLRQQYQGVYIANGGYDLERAQLALQNGSADLVAFGALFLANPDLPQRLETHADLNSPDPNTFYGGDETGYTDYPFLDTQGD